MLTFDAIENDAVGFETMDSANGLLKKIKLWLNSWDVSIFGIFQQGPD